MRTWTLLGCALGAVAVAHSASAVNISIGVRETAKAVLDGGGTPDPLDLGSNGGFSGGIEWINLDGQILNFDGTWQQFTWDLTPNNLNVTAFAGGTANGMLEGPYGTLEHIRVRNGAGETLPLRLFFDDLTYTPFGAAPQTVTGWEGFADGDEVVFQEPGFSGSTSGNLVDPGVSGVNAVEALTGSAGYESSFQFVDADPNRWVRLTTFNTPNLPNPEIGFNGQLSVWIKGEVVPEPASLGLLSLGALAMLSRRRA